MRLNALSLRNVDAGQAAATRALGAGVSLPFAVRDVEGELTLRLGVESQGSDPGVWLNTAVGALWLSDAAAVLSLLTDSPVVVDGPPQAWYWQFIGQQMSPALAQGLAPFEPLTAEALPGCASTHASGPQPSDAQTLVHCRLQIRLGEEQLYACLSAAPDTLLRWLQVPGWQQPHRPLAASIDLPFPLVLARASLTAGQLASLRPGDVLLPQQCLFDTRGNGHLELAGKRWASHTTDDEGRLYLTLSQEDYGNDE